MPLYRATITKGFVGGNEVWNNIYTLNCGDAAAARDVASTIYGIEQAVHYDTVAFQRLHVVNKADKHDQRTMLLGGTGSLHHDTVGDPLPLFCTMRVIFTDLASRPESKWLRRPGWTDQLTAGGNWDTDITGEIISLYMIPLIDVVEYVGPSGEVITSGSVDSQIRNRQIGWHRRNRPGFHRGWVPD
jgi:hypothetical protein